MIDGKLIGVAIDTLTGEVVADFECVQRMRFSHKEARHLGLSLVAVTDPPKPVLEVIDDA